MLFCQYRKLRGIFSYPEVGYDEFGWLTKGNPLAYTRKIFETKSFKKKVNKILGEEAHTELLHYLACEPLAGKVIPGSSGLRKLRWQLPGSGRRGGARVIYFFHARGMLILVSIYKKSKQIDIKKADLKTFSQLVERVLEACKRSDHE